MAVGDGAMAFWKALDEAFPGKPFVNRGIGGRGYETAKAAVELPCPWAGVVHRVLVDTGTTVEVGTPIIEVDVDPNGAPGPGSGDAGHERGDTPQGSEEGSGDGSVGTGTPPTGGAPASSGSVLVGYGTGGHVQSRRRKPSVEEVTTRAVAASVGGTGRNPWRRP